jgi:hypothetical protein|tara:strand:+ start:241 stop:495 length:255 start_codon:yes stop_codon:yes gene_type:complete
MKLPVIRSLASDRSISEKDINTTAKVLETIGMSRGITRQELNVIGELLSNLEGAKIVIDEHRHHGVPLKDSLNKFMQRVINSVK